MRLPVFRSPYPDRELELDFIAVLMLALGGLGTGAVVLLGVHAVAPDAGLAGVLFAAFAGASAALVWIFCYPWRAAIPGIAAVLVCALALLPVYFALEPPFLRDAAGVSPARISVVAGLIVGGSGLLILALALLGFVIPLVGAVRARLRDEPASGATLIIHLTLGLGSALILAICRMGLPA